MANWTTTDAVRLRAFIEKNPNFIAELESRMPKIDVTSSDRAAMSGAQHSGAEQVIKEINLMLQDQADEERRENIPDEE